MADDGVIVKEESLAFSPDGRWAATGRADGAVALWDMRSDNPWTMPQPLTGLNDVFQLKFSSNSRWLAAVSDPNLGGDSPVFVWDLHDPSLTRRIFTHHEPSSIVFSMCFSGDGRFLFTSATDGLVCRCDLSADTQDFAPRIIRGGLGVSLIATSPNGRFLAVTCWGSSKLELWDLSSEATPVMQPLVVEDSEATMAISQDSRWLAVGNFKDRAFLWDLESTNVEDSRRNLRGHHGTLWSIAFSPDSCFLVTGGDGGKVVVWPLHSNELVRLAARAAGRDLTADERRQYRVPAGKR